MLYFFLKPLVQVALKVYFRNIYISGLENIPHNHRFILAMNHPTAFLEPVIMAANLKKPVHFLVRGDHFNKSFYRFLLKQGKMIPVFRQKESGFGSLKYNYDTFSRCYEYIAKGEIVALFPEGRTENEKRLRPLQRGIARIAFGTLTHHPELKHLFILPIGVNYTEPLAFRATAMLHIGKPLSVMDYWGNEKGGDHQKLLTDLELSLKQHMVLIERESDEPLIEKCLRFSRNMASYPFWPVYGYEDNRLRMEQKVSTFWKEHASAKLKADTEKKLDLFSALLENWNIHMETVLHPRKPQRLLINPFFELLSFLGLIFGSPPAIFAEWVTKNKVKHPSFKSPVRFGAAFGGFFVYGLFFCFFAYLISPWFIPGAIVGGGLAYFSLYHKEKEALVSSYQRYQNLTDSEKKRLNSLKEELLSSFSFI
jgi:1-acyl-sn-glycerol-3-phosphate acyltransferase